MAISDAPEFLAIFLQRMVVEAACYRAHVLRLELLTELAKHGSGPADTVRLFESLPWSSARNARSGRLGCLLDESRVFGIGSELRAQDFQRSGPQHEVPEMSQPIEDFSVTTL
ncbi:hypothetical protein [Bradyrhizobium valentinum]|uniref:hypothetical protein n=1 Tax=Bradyrhizobium valentinum TaxID=1518501 RepID=UPI0012E3DD89|nr:hypothetical protein [Bradyrhizobium valentinum]